MICVTVSFLVERGHEKEATRLIHKILKWERNEPGLLVCEAYRSQREPRRFFIYQQFADGAAVDAHQTTNNFAEYVLTDLYGLLEPESLSIERFDPV